MNRTRVVRWLRVLLPLAALAMLSTLFLFSRGGTANRRSPMPMWMPRRWPAILGWCRPNMPA
ncbi:hypothetical protein ACFSYD_00970 [Paracoccus aerius]